MVTHDYIAFIGRFQMFHIAHRAVVQLALSRGKKVIILVGSADQRRTPKNPWTYRERCDMILGAGWTAEEIARIILVPLVDQRYNDQKWAATVQETVENIVSKSGWIDYPPRVALIGYKSDDSSYYLDMFPQWTFIHHDSNEVIHATDLRSVYFEGRNIKFLKSLLPDNVFEYVHQFKETSEFTQLASEYAFLKDYKKRWEVAPYTPTFVTADAVVIQSGHIILGKRGGPYGKNAICLPGGFVEQNESVEDAMIRELREETKVKVPAPVLRGSIKASKVFDDPDRSLRGRTITFAYLIELPSGPLPEIKGSDDLAEAHWYPLAEIPWSDLFEDHSDIIKYFLGQV